MININNNTYKMLKFKINYFFNKIDKNFKN